MPCYGVFPAYLKESVESILFQSYGNLELIVIIDPSVPKLDKEIMHVLDYFKDDKRLKVILHKSRKGLVNSLNEAILLSRGKYIARADGDDINIPFRIEYQINFMEDNKYHMVGSWALLIDENNKVISKIKKPVTPNEIMSKIMLHNSFLHPTVVIKKEIFKNVGLYDDRFERSEDYELWLRIISKGYLCANYPDYLVVLRKTTSSVTRGPEWLKNRFMYQRCKLYAFKNYKFNKFRDLIFLAITPLSLFIHPSTEVLMRKILGKLIV
jgi:glycosyltransferase involved in cell wall biosynthesis